MRILLTGGTGFIGRNILPILQKSAEVDAPSRGELDTVSEESVRSYFAGRTYDVVIHAANSNPFRNPGCDSRENMLDASLRGFMNLLGQKGRYGRMLYFGSGAEYDKRFDIVMAKEEQDRGTHSRGCVRLCQVCHERAGKSFGQHFQSARVRLLRSDGQPDEVHSRRHRLLP